MPELNDFDDPEGSYRRGYTQGAWAVMEAVHGQIPEQEYRRLNAWFNKRLRKWRMDAYTGKSKRSDAKVPTIDIAPPPIPN